MEPLGDVAAHEKETESFTTLSLLRHSRLAFNFPHDFFRQGSRTAVGGR